MSFVPSSEIKIFFYCFLFFYFCVEAYINYADFI